MPSMRAIKEKISSTKKTRKITKAMQMVAAAKLNRAEEDAKNYASYADKLREVVVSIASGNQANKNHPMLESRPVKRTGYLVLTESRGLAGAYDSNVLKYVEDLIKQKHRSKDEYSIIVTGKVGLHFFEKRNEPITFSKTDLGDHLTFDDVIDLAKKAVGLFDNEQIDELHLVYNHLVNAITLRLVDLQLLPLTNIKDTPVSQTNYIFEPDEDAVLEKLLPLYAEGQIYGAILDAKAAEFASRMNAMRSASDNASDIIDHLTVVYNQARQAAITKEITEIVGGVSALE